MTEKNLDTTRFVRGMAWHDIAKPFALGTPKHTPLGYYLLRQAGYEREAWAALIHGGQYDNLKKALSEDKGPLPAILLLTHSLDRIAASFYSLLSRRFNTEVFLGKDEDDVEKKNPLFHSWQNPFSRLPMVSSDLGKRFIIRESDDKPQGSQGQDEQLDAPTGTNVEGVQSEKVFLRRDEQLDAPLRDRLIDKLPHDWTSVIAREMLNDATKIHVALEAEPRVDADGQVLLRTLLRFQGQYPERTYPPANDTTLQEHGRLGGALAFVLYRNLEHKQSPWLAQQMWLDRGKVNQYLLGCKDDLETAQEIPTVLQEQDGWSKVQKVACDHLDARLVRVAFEGHRELFERAVRVDDLLGARALTDRFLDEFEETLAGVLGAPGLIWESEGDDRRCLLTIHRSQFDLFYLLPPYPTGDGATTIQEAIHKAYEKALKKVVGELLKALRDDFRKAVGKLAFGDEEKEVLRDQLRALSYRLRVLDLEVEPPDQVGAFADFTSAYGHSLVNAFGDSQKYPLVPWADLPLQAKNEEDVQLPADKTCDVCGNHPIFERFAELLDDEEWKSYVQKVVHYFREEPERPCISCIARRILSHGAVAEGTEMLEEMVTWDDKEYPPRKLRARSPDEIKDLQTGGAKIPNPPPALVASVEFEDDDDFQDLGAAYARYRRSNGHVRYDRPPRLFPTVSYAADANGNVVLLALQHTELLGGTYDYKSSINEIGRLPKAVKRGDRAPENDRERWQASVSLLYHWAQAQGETVLAENMITVKPHLARVMERIRHLGSFYRALKTALDETPMRVLPLDVDFPTLRLLLPADQLDQALRVLDRVVTEALFSATYYKDLKDRQEAHDFLKLVVPDLLHGAVVLFKQKFPLYLALEAERDLFYRLTASGPDSSKWYGFRLGFSDLRGSLSEVGPLHATVTYEDLGEVLDLAEKVDRRTVLQYAETVEYISPALAEAQSLVRAHRVGLNLRDVEALSKGNIFPPVHFIKRAIRR